MSQGRLSVDFDGLSKHQTQAMVVCVIGGCLVVSVAMVVQAGVFWDMDIWFILNTGRDIWEHGFTRIEPFTVHEGFRYLTQQWLAAAIDWKLYEAAGVWGVELFYLALWAVMAYVAYRSALVASRGRVWLSCAISCTFVLIMFFFIRVQPRVFDYLSLLLTYLVMHRYTMSGKGAWLALLPLIEVAIVNLHGSMWPLPFFAPLAYLAMQRGRPARYRLGIGAALAAMAACLIANPYGFDMVVYIANSLSSNILTDVVGELQPVALQLGLAWPFLIVLGAGAYLAISNPRLKRDPIFLLMVVLALMALWSRRNIPLFLTVSVVYFSNALSDENLKIQQFLKSRLTLHKMYLVGLGTLAAVLAAAVIVPGFSPAGIAGMQPERGRVLESLDRFSIKDGRQYTVYTNTYDGGYFEFYGYRCYIDGRAELFVKEVNGKMDIQTEYNLFSSGYIPIVDFLDAYDFDCLVARMDDRLFVCEAEVVQAGYQKVYENQQYKLYWKV